MLGSKSEKIRFWLTVVGLSFAALAVGVRLVMLHLDLVTSEVKTPNYVMDYVTQGTRGTIFGANGQALAKTSTEWKYGIDPKTASEDPFHPKRPITPAQRMEHIQTISELFELPLVKVMDAYARKSRYVYLKTSSDADLNKVLMEKKKKRLLPELVSQEKQVRLYPQGRRLAQVIGFVSKDPTNAVGGAGLELRYERFLKGTPGEVRSTKNALGRETRVRREIDVDARPGCSVHLTIDPTIQYEVEKALAQGMSTNGAKRAWSIVMSVKTGAILAMATLPDYDPAQFNKADPGVMVNRAIAECYEPGSVMKTITAAAAIDAGVVTPDTLISTARNDPRYYKLPGDVGHKWEDYMTVRDGIVHSSNIVFGKIGVDVGPERLYKYMSGMGLGHQTGVELPGEESGIIPLPKKWDKVKWSRAPIGQGIAVTALQLAGAYACIGNDGELLRPYLVEKVLQGDGEVIYQHKKEVLGHPIRPSTARQVRQMLLGVAKKGGTARRAAVTGYSVAGKTGTAQMKEGRGYSTTKFNASFIGIVPATAPEVVILVTYQQPTYMRSLDLSKQTGVALYNHQGGICAAPTFRTIASNVLRYLEVEPDIPDEVPDEMAE